MQAYGSNQIGIKTRNVTLNKIRRNNSLCQIKSHFHDRRSENTTLGEYLSGGFRYVVKTAETLYVYTYQHH